MSDTLRSRIAAAVARELVQQSRNCGEYQTRDCYKVADAVIRELGRYEYAVATADMDFIYMYADERSELDGLQLHPGEQIVRRYVTEWIADE